ncbi:tetratricopeptide repeat protein [Sediminitomix flava]|uniref:Tetratricopeptide repeat protein n=1 Tax=Sediminitomix flava TaxID=379075 RepID=A0A315ZEV3_SEDFL|nr:tetratricopeptide repeat protein [Sediminitomix flava]PWJ44051.1 tetratricopeptide repeat protein [Sediminitomix flava]
MRKIYSVFVLLGIVLFSCGPSSEDYFKQAQAKLNNGAFKEANSLLDEAIKIDSSEPKYYLAKGASLFSLHEYNKALGCFDKALALDSTNYKPFFNIGNIHRVNNNPKAAFDAYTKAIQLNSEVSDIYLNRALSAVDLGENKQAIIDFNQAQVLNPKDLRVLYYKGKTQMALMQFKEAINSFDAYLNLDKTNPEVYYFLAGCKTALSGNADDEVCSLLKTAAEMGYPLAADDFSEHCQ